MQAARDELRLRAAETRQRRKAAEIIWNLALHDIIHTY
jgi:hypothetical protein